MEQTVDKKSLRPGRLGSDAASGKRKGVGVRVVPAASSKANTNTRFKKAAAAAVAASMDDDAGRFPSTANARVVEGSSATADTGGAAGTAGTAEVQVVSEARGHYTYSLGQLRVPWEELGLSAQISLGGSLTAALPSLSEQGVVNSVHGLSNMGARWPQLSHSLRKALVKALTRVAPAMGEQGVAVTILSLAKLEVCWIDDLPEKLQNSLRGAISRQVELSEHALSNLLYGLGKLERPWEELHPEVRQTLKAAIVVLHLRDRCTAQGMSNSLYGLAHMHAEWSSLSSSLRLALFKEVTKALPWATESQFSSILSSLSKLGVQWTQIPEDLHRHIIDLLIDKAPRMNEQHLSNVLFALGSMGLLWQQLPSKLVRTFTDALLRFNAPRGNPAIRRQVRTRSTATLLSTTLSDDDDNNAIYVEKGKKRNSKEKQRSNDKEGRMDQQEYYDVEGFELTEISSSTSTVAASAPAVVVRAKLQKLTQEDQMNAQGLSMSIVGLSKLGAEWATLPSSVTYVLENSLSRLLPQMNSVQIASTLAGLQKLNWRWDNLQDSTKRQVVMFVTSTVFKGYMNYHDVSMTINALGSMGLSWQSVLTKSTPFTKAFYRSAHFVFRAGVLEEVAGIVLGMGLMDLSWDSLPSRVRKDFAECILRLFSQPRNPSLLKTQVPFTSRRHRPSSSAPSSSPSSSASVSPATVTAAINTATTSTGTGTGTGPASSRIGPGAWKGGAAAPPPAASQSVANIMYGLSLMLFDTQNTELSNALLPVHIALLDTVSSLGLLQFSEAEKEQILIYIHLLQTITPTCDQSVLNSHCPTHILRTDRPNVRPSKLQESVVTSLKLALHQRNENLEVTDEYSAFDGAFPVDATIFEGKEPVAFVEVDGPHHFDKNGLLRRKDLMKETLYRRKYPLATFTRIRYDQVDHLGSGYVGREVAEFITFSKDTQQQQQQQTAGLSLSPSDAQSCK